MRESVYHSPLALSFKRVALLAGLAGLGTWALYPAYLTTVDDRGYWEYSRSLRRGELREREPFAPGKFTFGGWPWQPPLNSLTLTPFPRLELAFTRGFLIHLCIALLGFALAGELGFALLALYPPLLLYSRTLMPEPLAALLFLLSYYLWRRKPFAAGLALGLLAPLRYQAVPAVLVLSIWEFFRGKKSFAAGTVFGLAALGLWLAVAYGGLPPVSGPYRLEFAPRNLGFFLMSLSLIYPMSFLGFKKLELPWALAAGAYALACLPMGILDWAGGFPGDLVSGVRLYLPVIPLTLVGYARLFGLNPLTTLGILLGLAGSWAVAIKHQARLLVYREIDEVLREYVHGPAFGNREALRFLGSKLKSSPQEAQFGVYVGYPREDSAFKNHLNTLPGTVLYEGNFILIKALSAGEPGKIPRKTKGL